MTAPKILPLATLALLWTPFSAWAFPILVSPPTARALEQISQELEARTQQMQIRCSSTPTGERCHLSIQGDGPHPIQQELISHPIYEDQVIAYRATGGSPEYRMGLYESLGKLGALTTEFAPGVLARKLSLESGKIRIRCTQSTSAPGKGKHQCWFIIHAASLLNDETSSGPSPN
jgi:hypothetical protein